MDTTVVSDDEESSVSGEGEAATDSPPGPTERKGKKTFSLAQKAYLNSLFEAGLEVLLKVRGHWKRQLQILVLRYPK